MVLRVISTNVPSRAKLSGWGVIIALLSFQGLSLAEMIPTDRRIAWQGNVGMVGDIPQVTTVYTTFDTPPTQAALQSALDSCPSNQVVKLGPWTNTYGSDLQITKSGVVLRGTSDPQGKPLTRIIFSGGRVVMRAPSPNTTVLSTDVDLTLDANKGDNTAVMLLVPSWIRPGELYIIDELDDPGLISGTGTQGGQTYREIEGNGPRGKAQLVRVTSTTPVSVTFELPLNETYRVSQTAQISESAYNAGGGAHPLRRAGIEDIAFEYTYADAGKESIKMENNDSCWLKNVQSYNCPGSYHVWQDFCYRCQIRHCEFSYSHMYGGGQGYGIALYHYCTAGLIEDNIVHHTHTGITVNYGCSGNVIAYNYFFDGYSDAQQEPSISAHGVCTWQCLFEGNYCYNKLLWDFTHGSAGSHHTAFRNRILGLTANGTGDQVPVSIERYNRGNNIIGNVLGVRGKHGTYAWVAPGGCGGPPAVYRLGYYFNANCDASTYDPPTVLGTLIHANYDVVTPTNNGIVWDPSTPDHTLPNSYYLASKPSWFGNLPWPPYSPASPTADAITNIPAGYRFTFGRDPASGPVVKPVLTISRAGGLVILQWQSGTLQQADDVRGPYANVAGAFPPIYTVPATASKKFYRVR
jgi:hypothetical protein